MKVIACYADWTIALSSPSASGVCWIICSRIIGTEDMI